MYATLTFNTSQGDHQLKIGGYIDRLDYIDISPEGSVSELLIIRQAIAHRIKQTMWMKYSRRKI